nr:unnamed protein product [Callosobruchus chinensis]
MKEKGEVPVKLSQYRHIFCTEYNIFFQSPKKDCCDVCELVKLHRQEQRVIDNSTLDRYGRHISEKNLCRAERNHDREDVEKVILCFDLQNVLTCPKADVNKFFYKSKLSVYNLTAHLSSTRQVYCSIWSEHMMGRKGNDIASALFIILTKVLADHPHLTELSLWSDSCVAQNRNSMLAFSVLKFLSESESLETITIKYSVPGHSSVQEVDATHSAIERVLQKTEYYSPLSLLRILLKVNLRNPYKVHQMQLKDFLAFHTVSSLLHYHNIPFSKVVVLQFSKSTPHIVRFKSSYTQDNFTEVEIGSLQTVKGLLNKTLKQTQPPGTLPQNKVDALRFMSQWMPLIDQ